jgi:structural maintenance of chromosome 2
LSLILSLLLFKPAPMYILDEIDAALDPSHTQNIGRMLKSHFSNSQFIVVSLKEGMFNNANVLFRTKFVSGQSTVTRTTSSHRGGDEEVTDKENVEPTQVKQRTSKDSIRKRKRQANN